ncbi:TolC family protein [Herbaspirillum camelliae]|uniref:TolC family protein n=1 Tax=Herbaspirillum camelliae TaxID=1892903 RepID=UPI000B14FB05|nr:TolC family protein [Herbaspirillum camelliae]
MKSRAVQQEPARRDSASDTGGQGGVSRKLMSALALCLTLALTGEDAAAVTLGELVKQAAFNNPAALSRQRAVEAAGESVSSARWQFFPNPSVSLERASSRNSRDVSYGGDSSVMTARLQQTLWAGGRLTAQLEQAEHNQLSAEEALREQRVRLAEQVISQYSMWVRSDLAASANDKNLQELEKFLEQSVRREREGAAARVDVTLVRGRRDQALTDLLGAKAGRTSARLQLEQLVGMPLTDEEIRADVASMEVSDDLPTLTESTLSSSPLIKRLRADAQVQESAIKIRQASYWPEVYARLEHQRGNYSVPHQPSNNRAFIGMQMQLGAGLSLSSEVAAARGRYESALLAVDAARLELVSQVSSIYTEYQQALVRSRNLEDVALSADEVLASYTRQYLSGRRSWLDVMNAVREVVQADLQRADVTSMIIANGHKLRLWAYGIDEVR